MESERKMKFKNIAKSVVAASLLSVASLSANAGAIATADLSITNLLFEFETLGAAPGTPTSTFSGSEATASINNIGSQDSWSSGNPPLTFTWSEGSGQDKTGTGAYGFIDIKGDIQNGGSTGITNSSASAYGVNSALGTSNVQNIVSATLTGISADILMTVSFGWAVNLYSEITDALPGQTATSSYDFTIEIEGNNGDFWKIDLQDLIGGSAKRTQQTAGSKSLVDNGNFISDPKYTLQSGARYTFTIAQNTRADVVSVPEPASVAILGLGLLGLAGAARRRKS